MTELAIREESAVARPAPQLPVPPVDDVDSWVRIVGQVVKLSNEIYDTPFVPDGLRGSAAAVSACILAGREMGLGPMTSLANIDVIRGKPTQKPLLMRAMIQSRGHAWEDVDVTDTRAVVRGRRQGESGWTEVSFTADQAKKAGINLGNYPADKLYARASSRLARRKFADVIMGIPYTPEDVEDGLDDDEIGTVTETGVKAAIEAPKSRTAQRKQRSQSSPPAQAASPSAGSAPTQAGAGGDLPPLPDEDEPERRQCPEALHDPADGSINRCQLPGGHDGKHKAGVITWGGPAPASGPEPVTPKQLTAIWTVLSGVFLFGKDERDEARKVCAHIVNRELASSKDMTKQEAATVLDTLAHWETQAEREGESPRGYLKVMTEETGGEPDE